MPGPLDFWNLVKEVNPAHIREDAARPFRVAAVGDAEEIARVRHIAGLDDPALRARAGDRWVEATLPLSPEARHAVAGCAFALSVTEDVPGVPVVTWCLAGDRNTVGRDVKDIMERFPHLALALPRFIPLFRREASDRVIAATARTNTELALTTAIPGVIPWTAPLLPATAFPDMILLTKNQVMMCLRLAAIYGLDVDPVRRIGELGGIIGAAFGWRAVAREVVGAVPGGFGAAAKGAIAYAGTVATGRAAQSLYETGHRPTNQQRRAWYDEAMQRGREMARETWDRVKPGAGSPEGAAA